MTVKHTRRTVRKRVHTRIRKRISGTQERPRLSVFKSGKHIYAQIIDDTAEITLTATSSLDPELRKELKNGATVDAAKVVGLDIAKIAKEKGISKVVYDRGGYLYHGRIKALADAARENGLDF